MRYCRTGTKLFHHPSVGNLRLDYETLEVGDSSGQRLLIHSADPGTPDAGTRTCSARPPSCWPC